VEKSRAGVAGLFQQFSEPELLLDSPLPIDEDVLLDERRRGDHEADRLNLAQPLLVRSELRGGLRHQPVTGQR